MELQGKIIAEKFKEQLKEMIAKLKVKPTIAIIPAIDASSLSYLRTRKKLAEELGINVRELFYQITPTQEDYLNWIQALNTDPQIHGIMIDRPLPRGVDESKIFSSINIHKDVEGVHPYNLGLTVINKTKFLPATAKAVIELLKAYEIDVAGKNVVIIGRSLSVGKPLALELTNLDATVTLTHSKSKDLSRIARSADILIASIGKPGFISKDYVGEEAIVIDVGYHYLDGQVIGDVALDALKGALIHTPVPGGVGPVTNMMIFFNLLETFRRTE